MSVSLGPEYKPKQERVNSMTGHGTNKLWRRARLLILPALVIVLDAFFAIRMPAQTVSWAARDYPTRMPVAGAHFNSGPEFGQFGDGKTSGNRATGSMVKRFTRRIEGALKYRYHSPIVSAEWERPDRGGSTTKDEPVSACRPIGISW
jgi:hypothetical protein